MYTNIVYKFLLSVQSHKKYPKSIKEGKKIFKIFSSILKSVLREVSKYVLMIDLTIMGTDKMYEESIATIFPLGDEPMLVSLKRRFNVTTCSLTLLHTIVHNKITIFFWLETFYEKENCY